MYKAKTWRLETSINIYSFKNVLSLVQALLWEVRGAPALTQMFMHAPDVDAAHTFALQHSQPFMHHALHVDTLDVEHTFALPHSQMFMHALDVDVMGSTVPRQA